MDFPLNFIFAVNKAASAAGRSRYSLLPPALRLVVITTLCSAVTVVTGITILLNPGLM